jgi:hypothetical protein
MAEGQQGDYILAQVESVDNSTVIHAEAAAVRTSQATGRISGQAQIRIGDFGLTPDSL